MLIHNHEPDVDPSSHISKREQTEQLLYQYDKLHHDKAYLANSMQEMELGYKSLLDQKSHENHEIKHQLGQAISAVNSLEHHIQGIDREKNQLLMEIEDWKLSCHSKLKKDIQPLDFENEIQKIKDPLAFGILKGLLTE